jgi:hypothetical protein
LPSPPCKFSFQRPPKRDKLTSLSASAATIIRMPYVSGLKNVADFLYATTDVAIWSITETGLGITASAAATLRPLFRSFFQRSRLMGGSSTKPNSNPWPTARSGYLRSESHNHTDQEIGLRSDIGKTVGVTTMVHTQNKMRDSDSEASVGHKVNSLEAPRGWNTSQSKLTEGSSEDFVPTGWSTSGIQKTTVISSHRT